MPWYREGTVTVEKGSKLVKGVDTYWDTFIEPGDCFTLIDANGLPTGPLYEVDHLVRDVTDPFYDPALVVQQVNNNPNRRLVLKHAYQGGSGVQSGLDYAILNTTGEMTTPRFAARLQNYIETARNLNSKPNLTAQPGGIPMAGTESPNSGKIDSAWIKNATDAEKGVVELATSAEAIAGTAADRAITPSVSGSRITFATTSTDDATSATSAPLKSAGGLAVAGNAWIGKSLKVGQSERHVYYNSSDEVAAGQSIFCTFVLHRWATAIIDLRVSMANRSYDAGRYAHISAQLYHSDAGELVVRRTDLALHTFLAESIVISKPSGYTNTTVTIQIINNTGSMALNDNLLLLDIVGPVSPVEFSVGNS